MKINWIKAKYESGQMIPLIVIMLFVIIGMVALILDGGAIMSNRREAQAAADAGAMAGAQRACSGFSAADAKSVAEHYATVNNNATSAVATVSGKQVTVNATVTHPSFFAKIFGIQNLPATAEATAGCFGVMGKHVVPLAWHCWPNTEGGPYNTDYGCKLQNLNWDDIRGLVNGSIGSLNISDYDGNVDTYYLESVDNNKTKSKSIVNAGGIPPEQIYIIIDSDKICFENSGDPDDIICDLDGDGKLDINAKGNRGWLYLTANTTDNIGDYIAGPDGGLSTNPHKWLGSKEGNNANAYGLMMNSIPPYVGQVVLIPVYNEICENDPEIDSSCIDAAHASPPWPYFGGVDDFSDKRNNSGPYYHIIAFAPFYVSCISTEGDCPGYIYAKSINPDLANKEPVIEGFFLSGYEAPPDPDQTCDINLGNCILSLSN